MGTALLTFGFPHWSHLAYLAGGGEKEGWLNEMNMRQARVTGCHPPLQVLLWPPGLGDWVRIEDVASYDMTD